MQPIRGRKAQDIAALAAEAVREVARERAELVHLRMQQASSFFTTFAAQMNVIAPRARQTMELPGVERFPDLVIRDLFVEERMQPPRDMAATFTGIGARYDYLLLSFHYLGPRNHTVVRDLAPEIERLESLLSMHRVRHEVSYQRNARAQIERAVFHLHSDISAGVKFIPEYENGRVRIALRNIDRLATWEIAVPAANLSQPLFEELARCVLGQPNDFQQLALGERTPGPAAPHAG